MYHYLLLILLDEGVAQVTRVRDHAQCEYIKENMDEDIKIARAKAKTECVTLDFPYKTGTEIVWPPLSKKPRYRTITSFERSTSWHVKNEAT